MNSTVVNFNIVNIPESQNEKTLTKTTTIILAIFSLLLGFYLN
jgi:hypothetical protein